MATREKPVPEPTGAVDGAESVATDATIGVPAADPPGPVIEAETTTPADPTNSAPRQDVVYVTAPLPPRVRGNRLFGSLISIVATVVYAAVLAGALAVLLSAYGLPGLTLADLALPSFYFPVILFAVGMILLAIIVNRAGWWSHLIGSIFVGLFVYFGSVAIILLMAGVIAQSPADAAAAFQRGLVSPPLIAAGLLAREVAIWTGAVLSWRGKRVKARNASAREDFDREHAEILATT